MTASVEPCVLPGCGQETENVMRLVVDGDDLVLPVCCRHASWLNRYTTEDPNVRVLDTLLVQPTDDPGM